MRMGVLGLLVLLAAWGRGTEAAGDQATGGLPEYHAADAAAAVVTEENLPASERFWPYHVALRRAWQPNGRAKPLAAGAEGVLIRVEPSGRARVDFGRDGLYEVPARETDLVERANRVRLGELEKTAPGLLYSIAPRLGDSASEEARAFPFPEASQARRVLCVFADPEAKEFAALATALAPLRDHEGTLTVFFPQGRLPDVAVRERLRALGWTVPFVFDHLAEPYTRTLLSAGTTLPAVQLQTNEGRVLLESTWRPDLVPTLTAALGEGQVAASRAP